MKYYYYPGGDSVYRVIGEAKQGLFSSAPTGWLDADKFTVGKLAHGIQFLDPRVLQDCVEITSAQFEDWCKRRLDTFVAEAKACFL